jgi:copper chaperone CopZ
MPHKRTTVRPAWLILIAIVLLGAGGLGVFLAGNPHAEVSVSAEVAGETKTVLIPVEGMSCVVCAASVKKALQSIDGVQEAEINLERREARVRFVEGKVSPKQLVAAVKKLGYKAGTPAPEAP